MSKVDLPGGDAVRQAGTVTREALASPWAERLARFGYAAKGLVYGLAGLLSLQVALGLGGTTTDSRGALHALAAQPHGAFMLALVALGLAGYVFWRLVQALLDPERKGNDPGGLFQRAGYAASGLVYGALAVTAAQMALGAPAAEGAAPQDWTARLLGQPFGGWLVLLGGLVVIGVGLYQLYYAATAGFRKHFKSAAMEPAIATRAIRISQFGVAARGLVLGFLGLFLVQAGLSHDPSRVRGVGEILNFLLEQPYGELLLGAAALGFIAYAVYNFLEARYHHIVIPTPAPGA